MAGIYQAEPPGHWSGGAGVARVILIAPSNFFYGMDGWQSQSSCPVQCELVFPVAEGIGGSETVRGEVAVFAKLALGSERLRLIVTNTRILVVSIGKRGSGAVATVSLFGRLGGALEDLFKSGRESLSARGRKLLSPNEILASNKDNFSIGYEEVVSVRVMERGYFTNITMLTSSDKFEFFARLSLENVVELLREGLGEKVSVGGLSR